MAAFVDYEAYDAVGLAELVRRRKVTPLELLDAVQAEHIASLEAPTDAQLAAAETLVRRLELARDALALTRDYLTGDRPTDDVRGPLVEMRQGVERQIDGDDFVELGRRQQRFDLEVVHLGDAKNRVAEADKLGVKSVPALVIAGDVYHINFGAALDDLR